MFDQAIEDFFKERKEGWLKKNIKQNLSDEEIRDKKQQCDELFSLDSWLPKAAKRAGQMSMATHPCTFSHPSARKNKNGYVTPVLAESPKENDGFLKSGNADVETDALGNAAVLDVYKFLNLKMKDSRKLIEHIRQESELARKLLDISTSQYAELRKGFLSMVETDEQESTTSSRIKQVYFPVSDGYHQFSVLANSGFVFELKKRIDAIRFSDEVKVLREKRKKNEFSEDGYVEIYGLTVIGYGGTKPQNISVLNNQYGGKAYLLESTPPTLRKQKVRFPKRNFFSESIKHYECREIFDALHRLFLTDYNNKRIREGRDYRLMELVDRIVDRMWRVRAVESEQYRSEYDRLSKYQKIWLLAEFSQVREDEDEWLQPLCREISRWIILSYKRLLGKQAVLLDDSVLRHVNQLVLENREVLR